ncbi:hypothetical protein [Streptomyces sp. NBC_01264]|uniref:hypothetical protein n=1 Tax=Streptomyces sp. NBC_01264 TaxID=2903804 RepID=UPI00224DC73E|nr:hypothetical protein [Streptomyces sp. NBC_01264]MCX4781805.1 hypothetical protein [Streptomyces sp. NBC_01264]
MPCPESAGAEPASVFAEALVEIEDLARAFTSDSLRLEQLALYPGRSAGDGPSPRKRWLERFLLLDIAYGEPTSAIVRLVSDLNRDSGALRPARDLSRAILTGAGPTVEPARGISRTYGSIARYVVDSFRPNLVKARALWAGPSAAERARLSADVTAVLDQGRGRLAALEEAFRTAEHAAWLLQTSERTARHTVTR